MRKMFIVGDQGQTRTMSQVYCADEQKELQDLLENNFELLAGDQINPKEPLRWLLIKREMPVPDPETGGQRWSIDFFFADQFARPTFVECKRYSDTRARREVIGQMMEYAANGQYYWDKEELREHAEKTTNGRDEDLSDLLASLQQEDQDSPEQFFERVETNLKEGQTRLIFFLEEAPHQLRSIVEFLNNQMERTEVLIIEARQYQENGLRVVAPTLFGFTEQARQVKRTVTVTKSGTRRTWDRAGILAALDQEGSATRADRITELLGLAGQNPDLLQISYGTGQAGSIIVRNNQGVGLFYVYLSGIVYVAATHYLPKQLERLRELESEFNRHLQWNPFEPTTMPRLQKKIDELSEKEFQKFKEFILKVAQLARDRTE